MKIPKTLKLPRKLKKELKKGFTRHIQNGPPVMSCNSDVPSVNILMNISYSGSNTKSFRRMCMYARKEEQRNYQKIIQSSIIGFDPAYGNDYPSTVYVY